MNPAILHPDVQKFIADNLQTDITRLLFSKSPFPGITIRELAEQIDSKKRCEKKLPLWYSTPGIYYPPKLAIEQSSSQAAALYKSNLIKGNTCIDLSGGFGADSFFLSQKTDYLTHCELNESLSEISKHNANILGAHNINFFCGDGMDYSLHSAKQFDTIYADPSRRVNDQKVFKLKDCEPDIAGNLHLLLKKASRIIIKTAPLLDIQAGLQELRQVSELHIISVKNDCKELLWLIDRDFTGTEPQLVCTAIDDDKTQQYSFKLSEEKSCIIAGYSDPMEYIYEPDVALLKAGCFKTITTAFGLMKLHRHTHLYTSENLNTDFTGRIFRLIECLDYRVFINKNSMKQANVICRNFPLGAEEVKKKHRIKDGGFDYLLFTTGSKNQMLVLHCQRL